MSKLPAIIVAFVIAIVVMFAITFPYFAGIGIIAYMMIQERNK